MDWDSPEDRAALIKQVGITEYRRQFAHHMANSVVCKVAGHEIRPVRTRFGRLYHVGKTDMAFATLPDAKRFAESNPTGGGE